MKSSSSEKDIFAGEVQRCSPDVMELGGRLPLSEDNGVRGFPGLDFQTGWVPFPCNTGIKTTSSSKTQVVDAPLAPVTPEKTITKENVLDSSASKPIGLCTRIEHCMKEWVHPHDGATPSNVPSADSKDEPSTEQHNSKLQVDDSQQSLTEILVKGSIGTEKALSDGIHLNRTPPQKPKRKKVRPKVVKEGMPRKSPNKEQASQRQEGTPVHGRHTTTGRKKRKDAITTTTLDVEESVCLPNAARVASCRRSLNFDSNAEACNDKLGSISQHAAERGRPTAGNPSEPAVVDVNGSLNNILASHLCFSQNSSPSLLKRKASSRWNAKNMARKKNSVDNGYIRETHQEHFVNSHESADMPRCGLQNLYDTSQQDDTIMSTESQSSIQTSTTISTGLVQVQLHTKGGPCSMDLQEQQNRHIQTSSNLRPHPFKESFTDRETEASPQEQQSYVMSSTPAQKGSAWEVGSVTTETSKKVVISRSGRQKAAEPSNHVHKETSLKLCEKQQSLITQCHPGEKYFNFQNGQEGNDMLVKIQVKAKRSPRKAPIHSHHPRTFFAINHGFMPQSSIQEREDDIACGPQTCQEALLLDRLAQRITKKRRKGISHAVKFASCTTVDRPENCTHQGQESHGVLNSNLVNQHETMAIRATHSVHDCGSSSNLKENLTPMFSSEVISFMKPIDEIVNRLRSLHIRERDVNAAAVPQNALVPYSAAGTIVPYAVTFKPLRKRRPRPKVDLDEETNIAWKLLMGIESAGIDGTDADKERWWGEERRVFRGRADSFIARMHLIQGDRRFSQWKGSVVDSIVGVFLTQNVSDHLSSSAFMALAARFPLNEESGTARLGNKKIDTSPQVQQFSTGDLDESVTNLNNFPLRKSPELDHSSMKVEESTFPDTIGRVEFYDRDTTGREETYTKIVHTNECETGQDSPGSNSNKHFQSIVDSNIPPTASEEENLLCFSVISSQNLTDCTTQAVNQIGSSPECATPADEFMNRYKKGCFERRSFSELLCMAESSMFKGLYANMSHCGSHGEQFRNASDQLLHEKQKTNLDKVSGAGPSLEIDNCSKINGESKTSSAEATSSVTIFVQEAHRISSLDKATNTDLQSKSSQDGHCLMVKGSLHFSSKGRETVDVDSLEQTKRVENQKPLESKLATVSKDEAVKHRNKPRREVLKSNKGKGEALSTKETWEPLRRQLMEKFGLKERTSDKKDSLDWEAVRHADVSEVAQAIKERGMNNKLAARIQEFLNRLVEDHGSIDLEWLRDIPPDKAKDFLLSINGLGLKSVECVDTNVGRICVRLGWVPLQPLPESLQLHLLEMYPVLESIQKYLWPRLCKLDQRTLYELHYQLITFGKVFCTKSKPNCNACPMRGECKHFASAFASARLSLPAPEEKNSVSSSLPFMDKQGTPKVCIHPVALSLGVPSAIERPVLQEDSDISKCEPIIEEPSTPEPECVESSESVIEDFNCDDPDEIPSIKLNLEEFTLQVKNYIQEKDIKLQDADVSKALVALTPMAASIPTPKLKNMSRLRTEHHVYELPDNHPLVEGLDKRESDDPCFYLLAIWSPGETAQSIEPPKTCCDFQASGNLCDKQTCFSCNAVRETTSQTVRGTLLIPCRTAMRGSFPLNGTYFQVNEVFADHESSLNPIAVPRALIWNLRRRTVYFGTSVTTIFRGMTTEGIQHCFWRGFVCVRGFDLKKRAPRPLVARFHFPASKQTRNQRTTTRKLDEQAASENFPDMLNNQQD
ncbi:DNA glycosylase/AP lyase ROS1-like isoform X2 [Nymphaea colorata]|uniref:DNA glycosylase/AP lyase ROS1-like isoform X2 n=1 Tax=Nymphaea colorata TaxID=210225 RepID=UPI00129E4842|nr:DNA glycosylase/AP lyase ROS1-like isoform X2 [Nymphaea colorata]